MISIMNTVVFGFLAWLWSSDRFMGGRECQAGWASHGGQVSAVKPGATLPEVTLFPGSLRVMSHLVRMNDGEPV